MSNNTQQQVDKLTIKNRLNRIDLSNDKFLYLTFKSSVNGKNIITTNNYGNVFYTNPYSYLEFEYNEVNNPSNNNSFGLNFYELSLFLDKLLLTIEFVNKNVSNIKSGSVDISSLNLAYTMGNNFQNAVINITFNYINGKIIVALGYNNMQQQKLFNFNSLSWTQYKILIEELKQIKNNWHILQNTNAMLMMYNVSNNVNTMSNNVEAPIQQYVAPIIEDNNIPNIQPQEHIEVEDPQDILPPWDTTNTPVENTNNTIHATENIHNNINSTTNNNVVENNINVMSELDGFENDKLEGVNNSLDDDLSIEF